MIAALDLSVILIGCEDAAATRRCLAALQRQTLPAARFEIIAVNTGAQDLVSLKPEGVPGLRVVRARGQGNRAQDRNDGLREAAGLYCLFLDARSVPAEDLLAAHLGMQQAQGGVVGIGDRILEGSGSRDTVGPAPQLEDCDAGNLSAPRAALLAAGGFDVDLPADVAWGLGYRLVEQGLPLVRVPSGVQTQDGETGRALIARAGREGAAAVVLYRRHPGLLAGLRLGRFNDANLRSLLLRKLLLRLRVPPAALGWLLSTLWPRRRPAGWLDVACQHSYWRGAQRALGQRDTFQRLAESPIILMYHAIGREGEKPGTYVVPRRSFERQMMWLSRRGRPVICLESLLADRQTEALPPARAVIVTFDDGYRDNKTLAQPVLRAHRFPATVFVVTGCAGDVNRWDQAGELAGRPLLSWQDMREMQEDGITLGAHSRTHPSLTKTCDERLDVEVAGARADLERELAHPCLAFAYPHGESDARVESAVARAGYLGACCSLPDRNDPAMSRFALRRVEIRGTDSFVSFVLTVWLGKRMSVRRFITQLATGV